jgi:hypothetical protein
MRHGTTYNVALECEHIQIKLKFARKNVWGKEHKPVNPSKKNSKI